MKSGECNLFFALIINLCLVISQTNADAVKTWMPNTNYWDPMNWDVKRMPCRNDLVIFPSSLSASIALHPGATSVKGIVLPTTGELLLSNGDLILTGLQNASGCIGEDVEFTGGEARYWLDPGNWNGPSGEPLKGGQNSPIPHSERIPCETDQVIFLNGGTFQVQLPDVPVKVGAVNIEGKDVSLEQLHELVLDDTGFHLFKGDASQLEITNELCQDPRGCICNADLHPLTWQRICSFESVRCALPMCENPIKPKGFCCPICGAAIYISFKGSWPRMKQMIESMIDYNQEKGTYPVLYHISRVGKNELQVVLRDPNIYTSASVALALVLQKQFETVSFETTPYTRTTYSGDPVTSWGTTSAIISKILLAAVLVLGVAFAINHLSNKTGTVPAEFIQPSFLFARFENTAAEGEVEITQQAFHNPMFDIRARSVNSLEGITFKELEDQENLSEEISSQSTERTFSLEE
ncbi:protein amnionless isoform X2 [Neocloeon triangulifer]|uniref:protein amnionless isoform X2 n=1 Tax=Neocloeon triangulifer TaxID=2078957 RepID=UPI00286F2B0C|nr:protein amnionless isoform X2 [Neocloeon triangulifer]